MAREGESLDDVVADLHGATWLDAESWRLPAGGARLPILGQEPQPGGGALAGEAEARGREAERALRQVTALKAELKEVRAAAAKGRRDTVRWKEKAEQRRLEAVALRQARHVPCSPAPLAACDSGSPEVPDTAVGPRP